MNNDKLISEALKLANEVFQGATTKKCARAFKSRYSIALDGAPKVFVKHNTVWKLFVRKSTHRNGKGVNKAEYLPLTKVADKFARLERQDIKTEWD